MTESFSKVKSASKEYAQPSDEITLTLVLTNNSEYDVTAVSIMDTITEVGTFKAGTIEIDGTPYEDYDIVSGFPLENDIVGNVEKPQLHML